MDYEKAFDRVGWSTLLKVLNDIGVDLRDRRLIVALYMGQRVVVRLKHRLTSEAGISRGIRQGCSLSPEYYLISMPKLCYKRLYGM